MNGFIIVNKEQNITSFGVCSRLRRITGIKKIGHTGTLDPMACGVLVAALGNAAKLIDYIPNHDKEYTAGIRFGYTSDTYDIWGTLNKAGIPSFDKETLMGALNTFKGDITQFTPAYSAARYNGRHLYEYARKGIEVELPKRDVSIKSIKLLSFDELTYSAVINVQCSKGTYIRSICNELGEMLGCGAVMESLLRTRAGNFTLKNSYTLAQIEEKYNSSDMSFLLPYDIAISHLNRIDVDMSAETLLRTGSLIPYVSMSKNESVAYDDKAAIYINDRFAALGVVQANGIKPYKVFI